MEILHQSPIQWGVISYTTVNDEIFQLHKDNGQFTIKISDSIQALEVKGEIPMNGHFPLSIVGSSSNNCVYVLNRESEGFSVWRIDTGLQFQISPFIPHLRLPNPILYVTRNGDLLVLSNKQRPVESLLRIYDANGCMKKEVNMRANEHGYTEVRSVIQRSDGHFVVLVNLNDTALLLWEMDADARIVRKFPKRLRAGASAVFADKHDRIVISGSNNELLLLDKEFNCVNYIGPNLPGDILNYPSTLVFNTHRNDICTLGLLTRNGTTTATAVTVRFRS